MKLSRITIDGFRSLRNIEITGIGDLNVIIGKNDCGKSNVLKSLDLFFNNAIDGEKLNWETDFNTTYLKAKGKRYPSCITIGVEFTFSEKYSSSKLYKKIREEFGNQLYLEKKYFQGKQELHYRIEKRKLLLLDEKDDHYSQIFDLISYVHYLYIPINKDESWLKESFIFSDIKNRFMDGWGKSGSSQKQIRELRAKIQVLLNDLKMNVDIGMKEVTKNFKDLFPEYRKVTFRTPANANELFSLLDIEITSSENITTILGSRGSGVQSASVPLLLFYVDAGKQLIARNSLYIPIWGIEEPESFQHDDLANSLASVFYEKISPKIQVMMTTHSHYYLRSQNMKNIHLLKLESGFSKLAETKDEWFVYFEDILNEIGSVNISSDLFHILKTEKDKKFIVFEGIYDIQIFEKAKELNKEVADYYKDYIAINGDGGNLPGKVKILDQSGNQVIVCVDDDEDGRKYIRELEKNKPANLILKKYQKDGRANCVLETFISEKVLGQFQSEIMTDDARRYWFSESSRMQSEIVTGATQPPKGWDKNGLKNKLCDYMVNNVKDVNEYSDLIIFYKNMYN